MTATFADLLIAAKCDACRGTGLYHYTRDGSCTKTRLPCFRCGGKGHQTQADVARNASYDHYARRVVA